MNAYARRALWLMILCASVALVLGFVPMSARARENDADSIVVIDSPSSEDETADGQTIDVEEEVLSPDEDESRTVDEGEPWAKAVDNPHDAEEDTGLVTQAVNVSDPRVVADSSMTAGQVATWDCVWLGSYPQAYVSDTATVAALDAATGWDDKGDLTYGGATYRRQARIAPTHNLSSSSQWDWDAKVSPAGWCYFRWAPVKWRVLEVEGTQALVISDSVLDSKPYNESYAEVTWATCTLRSWLGGSFWSDAFTTTQREGVSVQALVNSDNITYGTAGGENTADRVFLLAESDVCYNAKATRHGFVAESDIYDEAGRSKVTDYAYAIGAYKSTVQDFSGNCWWWLRSPGKNAGSACYVGAGGKIHSDGGSEQYDYGVGDGGGGVRPAMYIDLSSSSIYPAGTVSSKGDVSEIAAPYTGAKGSGAPVAGGGTGDTAVHYVSGYHFLDDSYSFENFAAVIPYPYWATMYEEGAGKLFFHQSVMGGVCYGMSFTTASILRGVPYISDFVLEGEHAGKIRDLVPNDAFGSYRCSMVSLTDELLLPIDSFIKYAQIYQCSTEEQSRFIIWDGQENNLQSIIDYFKGDASPLPIHLDRKNAGHTVLAVGCDGNDILVDDPNNDNELERITVHEDGTWEFSGFGSFNSSREGALLTFSDQAHVTRPYEILSSGTAVLTAAEWATHFGLVEGDAIVEGMNRLDEDSTLVRVAADACHFETDSEVVELNQASWTDGVIEIPFVDTKGMYWVVGTNDVTVTDLEGDTCTVEVGADDVLLSATVAGGSSVSTSIDGDDSLTSASVVAGTPIELTFETSDERGEDVVVTISGASEDGGVRAESVDGGYVVDGLSDVRTTIKTNDGTDEASAEGLGGNEVTVLVDSPKIDVEIVTESDATDLTSAVVTVAGATYTGKALEPTVTVTLDGVKLVAGTDYTLSYENNTNAGTATVIVTGQGSYKGKAKATFTIAKAANGLAASAKKAMVSTTYSASKAVTVALNVKASGAQGKLTYANASTDATAKKLTVNKATGAITVPKGTKVGTYTVKVKVTAAGDANHKAGSKTVSFRLKVNRASIAKATVAAIADQSYTGKAKTPAPTVKLAGVTLKNKTDYTLSYANNVKVSGSASVTITGVGNYTGTKKVTFRVAFKDVPTTHPFYDKIHRANDLGIINGYKNADYGKFGPGDDITRGQIAVMLWNAAGKPKAGSGARSFKDVIDEKAYYYHAVRWAASVGVVNGYSNGAFGPNDNITREQLAVMISNYAKNLGGIKVSGSRSSIASIPDIGSVSGYAVPSVAWCYKQGIFVLQNGRLNARVTADRATAAQMACDLYDLLN